MRIYIEISEVEAGGFVMLVRRVDEDTKRPTEEYRQYVADTMRQVCMRVCRESDAPKLETLIAAINEADVVEAVEVEV